MQTQTKPHIAIFGNGKFARALVHGLLRSGKFKSADITVITREHSFSDRSFFEKSRVAVTADHHAARTAENIVLCVTPAGSGEVLSRLGSIDFIDYADREIVSFVSGLSIDPIQKIASVKDAKIIRATGNTNIAFNKGLVYATDYSRIFWGLEGTFTQEKEEDILDSVVSIGSLNAFIAKAILLCHKTSGVSQMDVWVNKLYHLVHKQSLVSFIDPPVEYKQIISHLYVLATVMTEAPFSYQYDAALERVRLTLKSILETVVVATEHHSEHMITQKCFENIINSVVTKGGCTEKGINDISSIDVLLDKEKLSAALLPVMVACHNFPTIVAQSLQNASLTELVVTH